MVYMVLAFQAFRCEGCLMLGVCALIFLVAQLFGVNDFCCKNDLV